jgi:alpha-glucosidase (family GH31 glycosyl hydrolase)
MRDNQKTDWLFHENGEPIQQSQTIFSHNPDRSINVFYRRGDIAILRKKEKIGRIKGHYYGNDGVTERFKVFLEIDSEGNWFHESDWFTRNCTVITYAKYRRNRDRLFNNPDEKVQ